MDLANPEPLSKIVVVVQSPHWRSVLQNHFKKRIITSISFAEGMLELASGSGDAIIVELTRDNVGEICQQVFRSQEKFNQSFFAVGDPSLAGWLPLIRVCGWSAYCDQISSMQNLIRWVGAISTDKITSPKSTESQVADNLPWRPVT